MRGMLFALAAIAAAILACPGRAQTAGTLWYTGDGPVVGAGNIQNSSTSRAYAVFQDFIVQDAAGWHVTELWSNNTHFSEPDQDVYLASGEAEWSIRTGLSNGGGGAVLFGAVGPAEYTPYVPPISLGRPTYNCRVRGLDIDLAPGRYWLCVAPHADVFENSLISGARGLNAVGIPPGYIGDVYWQQGGPEATTWYDHVRSTYSMGLAGYSRSAVPEPGTASLVLGALPALAVWRRRR